MRKYHLAELRIARDPTAPGHILPPIPDDCTAVLELGCGAGQALIASNLRPDVLACGVDSDEAALRLGRELTRSVDFVAAVGRLLPFRPGSFDMVFARVALPYTNIPQTLEEAKRLLRPGGRVWFTLHPVHFAFATMRHALRQGNIREAIFASYVLFNGIALATTGRLAPWPLGRRRYESVQTVRGMRRLLAAAGFEQISVTKGRFFVATARKAGVTPRGVANPGVSMGAVRNPVALA